MNFKHIALVLLMATSCMGAWSDMDVTKPADNRRWDLADDDIRLNWTALVANLNLAAGGLVIGNTTGALDANTAGLTTEMLVGGGTTTNPVWTTATGTGAPVRATSPTLVTPNLGTPSVLVGTNISGTAANLTVGAASVNSIDGTMIAIGSQATGSLMYYNGTDWVVVTIGTAAQHFTVNSGATAPEWTSPEHHYNLNIQDPNAVYTRDTQICIDPNTSGAITITEVQVTLDADPTTEVNWNLKYADAFIGLANATLIVACDTTTGTADIDSGFSDATVATGKCIYLEFDAQPDTATTQASVKVTFTYD